MQPIKVFWSELVAGPDGSGGGEGIEVIQFEQAGGGFVVIAADKDFAQAAGAIDNFVGRGTVTYDVAEVGYEVEGWRPGEAGFQGFEVGMNVTKQQYAQ
jgi:hypothetical protein